MKEALRQQLTQRLQQKLSPRQVRLVRLLEMSEPEMEDEVRRELDDNPALIEADRADIHQADTGNDSSDTFTETAEEMQRADYGHDDEVPYYRREVSNTSADDRHFEPTAIASAETLAESLERQLAELPLTERQLMIGRYIIGNIDDNGYLTRSITELEDDLAFDAGVEVEPSELREMVETVRRLDPAGVGATDLRDSLLLQLKRMPEDDPAVALAIEIVRDYFDLFSLRHFDRLAAALHIDREQLRDADDVIRSLDPKPGSRVGDNEVDDRKRHITPDFLVETDDSGRVSVSMPSRLPSLAIEQSFDLESDPQTPKADSSASSRQAQALEFIARKRDEATEFIELVKMRRTTLMKVMEAIVRAQKEFFLTEDETTIRPMVLKDIAAATGFDISVISRATSGKYVATPTGVYPLKFFFNERLNAQEDASSHEIMDAIRQIIDGEDPASPVSDEVLTEQLAARGYNIARRTVAKYRERLGIPVARLRRKL